MGCRIPGVLPLLLMCVMLAYRVVPQAAETARPEGVGVDPEPLS